MRSALCTWLRTPRGVLDMSWGPSGTFGVTLILQLVLKDVCTCVFKTHLPASLLTARYESEQVLMRLGSLPGRTLAKPAGSVAQPAVFGKSFPSALP